MSGAVYVAVANFFGAISFRSVLVFVASPQLLLGLMLAAFLILSQSRTT